MAHDDPNSRVASKHPCIYWGGDSCTATSYFAENEITCYHDGNCDGFGTCRGCSKYDQGGLKFGASDGSGGPQLPMNLQLYNLRAKVKPCCHWDAAPDEFVQLAVGVSPTHTAPSDPPDEGISTDKESACTLTAARPWQTPFTDENPTAYGCNGAKSECPYYTGPKFTELVDAKMDTGDKISAKQVLELRFHSADWASFPNPREEYERRFTDPDIWAWALEDKPDTSENLPGKGSFDEFGNPRVQLVSIKDVAADAPEFKVGGPVSVTTGTPTQGGAPKFPDLIKNLNDAAVGMEVIWPRGTTRDEPFIKQAFTQNAMLLQVLVQINSDYEAVAINVTQHPQDDSSDSEFVTHIKQNYPTSAVYGAVTSKPGLAFNVPLVLGGKVEATNIIRIFLDTESEDGSMLTADIHIRHIFYHAEVAQTSFRDTFGHPQFDPWINHFTEMNIEADFIHLTNNTEVHEVLWNTTTTTGKKTIYAVEKVKSGSSEDGSVSWEPLLCSTVAVTFNDPVVNRVYPWRAWGDPVGAQDVYVKVDRSNNPTLVDGEPEELELAFKSTSPQGLSAPANLAFFEVPSGQVISSFNLDYDILNVSYAYTGYKQGPINPEDTINLKYLEDVDKIIDADVYIREYTNTNMSVGGTYVKMGDKHVSSCSELLGDCFTEKSIENEGLAKTIFFAGGIGESGIKTVIEMQTECREKFDAEFAGKTFEDGTPVSLSAAVDRLADIETHEGSQHYDVIFKDRDGRPIGRKRVGFLTQSAHVQTRDVEIRYKWSSNMQHYQTIPRMLVHAVNHEPTFASQDGLSKLIFEYDPVCGDHTETHSGLAAYTEFDLQIDEHGPLWYPYKQCLQPRYHMRADEWWSPVNYQDTVEGFDELRRRNYWERMRWFDQYKPSVMNIWAQIGCFFSQYTTTANSIKPVTFTGYTKIRSNHPFGHFNTDREAIRLSRHWEKRQLLATEEVITQGDNGLTVKLSDEYTSILYDEDGNLKAGAETPTPIWVHMSDDFSVVKVTSESMIHPFSRHLLKRVGNHTFNEIFSEERKGLDLVFEDRDHTSNTVRSTDGVQVHVPNEPTANNEEGEVSNKEGRDIKWAFTNSNSSWAWLAPLPEPKRAQNGSDRVTGLHLTNVSYTFFKKNKRSATHPEEGNHRIVYTPHTFTDVGDIETAATISLDDGPVYHISQTDGLIYITDGSPYDSAAHANESYEFELFGRGPLGVGVLADSRGLQYFGTDENKLATYAGININLGFDINELPHNVVNINRVGRLSSAVGPQIKEFVAEYTADNLAPVSLNLDFKGHYYVEEVTLDFDVGPDIDIPAVRVSGFEKVDGVATVSGTVASPTPAQDVAVGSSSYHSGKALISVSKERKTYKIRKRLFTLDIALGSRLSHKRVVVNKVQILLRDPAERSEEVYLYEPLAQVSSAHTGTNKPSDLEFYFQRTDPDFAKNYQSGQISLATLGPGDYSVTKLPGTDFKLLGRQIKDLIPMFNFSGFSAIFPYDGIDIPSISNYVETEGPTQTLKYIAGSVATSSKGWTMSTSSEYSDPFAGTIATDSGPEGVSNVSTDVEPNEDLQEFLYNHAAGRLGDNIAVYSNFWHPDEKEFFQTEVGIDLEAFSWELRLHSTIAPLDRVYRDYNYGCHLQNTNEDLDGLLHKIPLWQAKGAFHYLCDPRFSWSCITVVMNKCNEFLFKDYGTSAYLSTDVVDAFTYKFEFPPTGRDAYISRGLFNKGEIGGYIGGTGGVGIGQAAAPYPSLSTVHETYQSELAITGENKYQ